MNRLKIIQKNRTKRANKIRSVVKKSVDRPRLSVNISNRHVFAQIIDDKSSKTVVAVSSLTSKTAKTLTEKAQYVGSELSKSAKKKKITKISYDRGSRKYHGRVKALAQAAREGGLEF